MEGSTVHRSQETFLGHFRLFSESIFQSRRPRSFLAASPICRAGWRQINGNRDYEVPTVSLSARRSNRVLGMRHRVSVGSAAMVVVVSSGLNAYYVLLFDSAAEFGHFEWWRNYCSVERRLRPWRSGERRPVRTTSTGGKRLSVAFHAVCMFIPFEAQGIAASHGDSAPLHVTDLPLHTGASSSRDE